MSRKDTLLLDRSTWDLVVDARGNIAVASAPYALAQDVASAIQTYRGEAWYNTAIGVPYKSSVLGKRPPVSLLREYFGREALTVPGVVKTSCTLKIVNRKVIGQIEFVDEEGIKNGARF